MTRSPNQRSVGHGNQFLRPLASLLTALGLVFGVPLALVLFVGWPLPSEIPTWDGFTEALEQQGITYEVLTNALAVVVWLAWAPLVWAILVEAVAVSRGRAARQVHAWPGAQYLARKLVASAALLATSVGGMRGAAADPLDPLVSLNADNVTVAEAEAPPDAYGPDLRLPPDGLTDPETGDPVEAGGQGWRSGETVAVPDPAGSASGSMGSSSVQTSATSASAVAQPSTSDPEPEIVHMTERGDTFWGLAERYLDSGMRWREIRDHNAGRAVAGGRVLAGNEDHLEEGWRIVIPAESESAPDVAPSKTRDGSGSPGAGSIDGDVDGMVSLQGDPNGGDGQLGDPPGSSNDPSVATVDVQPGDHFWALAERQLEDAWGRPVTADEIAPYWQQLVAANLDDLTSGDPDLVYPGEQFSAPPAPPAPEGSTAVEEPAEPAEPPAQAEEPSADAEAGTADGTATTPGSGDALDSESAPEESDTGATTSPGAAEVEEPPVETEEPPAEAEEPSADAGDASSESSSSGEASPAPGEDTGAVLDSSEELDTGDSSVDAADDDDVADDDESPSIPAVVPFGASAALAGLLLVSLRRRRLARRRLLQPGVVVEPRPEEDARLEREFALGARDVLDTVAATSRGYGAALASNPDLPLVTGMTVSPALDVVVHLAEPAVPEVPFEKGPASDRWELYLDELDLDPEFGPGPDQSVSVLDTPTVVGRTDEGDWVLVDLESIGAVEIDGDVRVASDLVRSIVAELALQPQAERMVDITVVGVDGLSSDVLEQGVVTFDYLDEDLVRRVERVAAETDSLQAHRGAAARAQGLPRDGLFVTVVALGGTTPPDPMLLERLAAAATPGGRGVAVVAVGAIGAGATRVLVDDAGQAHIPHMGVTVNAVQLAPENLQRVEQLLADEPEYYRPAPEEGVPPESWPEWRQWAMDDAPASEDDDWMGSWLSSSNGSVVGDLGNAGDEISGFQTTPPEPVPESVERVDEVDEANEEEAELSAHEVDTAEVEGLDDMAPPDLHVVGEGFEASTGPEPEREPLSLRDEPDWPDPRVRSAAGGPGGPGEATAGLDQDQRRFEASEAGAAESGEASEAAEGGVPAYQQPPWEFCVRIFGDHVVEDPDGEEISFRYGDNPNVPNKNTHRGPELLAYLALSGRAATAEEVRDHMWWDRPVALGTVNKLLYGTRKVLGGADLLSHAQEDPLSRYRLAPTVVTDVQLLTHALEYARAVANRQPSAAVDTLRAHLGAIEAVAFRNSHLGQGLMEWAAAYRVVDMVEQPVVEAALLMSRLSCERGRSGYFDALWAIDQGLRACPFNEALVRVAMEIEALLGNVDAVNHRYLTLATKLARDELEPEPDTSELRARLGGTSRLRSVG